MSLSWTAAVEWLLHCAVGGGVLLLLTCLLMRRTRQPARQQRLGELGLAAALVLAVLSLRPPWLVFALPVAADPAPAAARVEFRHEAEEAPGDGLVFLLHEAAEPAAPPDAEPVREVALAAAPEPARPWWQSVLLALLPGLVVAYAFCGVLLLGRWLLGHFALARLLRGSRPAPREVLWLFKVMAPARLRPRLLVAPRLRVPVSFGLLRPTVVLPQALCEPPDLHKLRWVFAHELTHLERRDAWSALLFAVGQAVYFFLPWFGWLRRRVRLCQEYVADAAAAGKEEPAVDYAEFLLSLTGAPAVPAAAAGVTGNCSDLYRRVTMLLKEPSRVEKRCPRRWSLAAAGGLFALAILAGGVGLRADAAQVVVIIPGPDGKPGPADQKARVIVVPGGAHAAKEDGQRRKVIINQHAIPAVPALPALPGHHKAVREIVVKELGKARGAALMGLHRDGHLEEVHKLLQQLERHPGAAQAEEIRKEVHKLLAQRPALAGQRADDGGIERGKRDDGRAQRGTEAALKALRKALEKMGQQPELEQARQQLRKAIEQLERAHKGEFGLRMDKDADGRPRVRVEPKVRIELGQGLGKGVQQWNFGGAGGGGLWGPGGKAVDAELLKKIREELKNKNLEKAEELLRKALEGAQGQPGQRFNFQGFNPGQLGQWQGQFARGSSRTGGPLRLGVVLEKPSAALADQLNLPEGKGLIIRSVKADSPAAKAGLKANDVLLELNGKPVGSNTTALGRLLEGAKGGTASAVVLRKGKRETIRDIHLGEPAAGRGAGAGRREGGAENVSMNLRRSGDRFTMRYQADGLSINVVGTVSGGKAKADEIRINDGRESNRYDSVDRVPAQYRDRVNHLLELSGRGEARTPSSRRQQ